MHDEIHHALVLNFHQPAGNLEHLLASNTWEAKEILYSMDRVGRTLWEYDDIARVHLSLSGTLLETLMNPGFQHQVYGIIKCGDLLWHLQNQRIFDILGTGYYHPVFPLAPTDDWEAQIQRWLGIGSHLFWRTTFPGFWPPEMGFSMEMIPMLRRSGFRYVIVDVEHVEPLEHMRWEEIRYQPHYAEHEGERITVIVRDRDLSNAQQSGMDANWFRKEVYERTKWCDFPPLVTTCTNGDAGGWFRNTAAQGNFWSTFYQPLLEMRRRGDTTITPTFLHTYLDEHEPVGRVHVRTGAWNTGWHNGVGFTQWTGTHSQKLTLERIQQVSAEHAAFRREADQREHYTAELFRTLDEAYWRLLRAQTSTVLAWGEAWLERCHRDLDDAQLWLARSREL